MTRTSWFNLDGVSGAANVIKDCDTVTTRVDGGCLVIPLGRHVGTGKGSNILGEGVPLKFTVLIKCYVVSQYPLS